MQKIRKQKLRDFYRCDNYRGDKIWEIYFYCSDFWRLIYGEKPEINCAVFAVTFYVISPIF